MLDLSKGQLNSRFGDGPGKHHNAGNEKLGKLKDHSKMTVDIPIIPLNKSRLVSIVSKKSLPASNLVSLI